MLEKNINAFRSNLLVPLGQKQTAVKFKMFGKDEDIRAVLSADITPFVTSVNSLSQEVEFAGKVSAKVVATEADGTVFGMSYSVDFSDSFKNEAINTDSVVVAYPSVLDVSTDVSGTEVLVNAVISTDFCLLSMQESSYLDGGNFAFRLCETEYGVASSNVDDTFTVGNEVEIKDNIAKVLLSKTEAILNAASINDGVLNVDGEIVLNIVYLSVDSKDVKNALISFPFSREVNSNGNGTAIVDARVKSSKIHLDVIEDSKSGVFSVEAVVEIKGVVLSRDAVSAVCDAYSVTNETTLTNCSVLSTVGIGVLSRLAIVEGETEADLSDNALVSGAAGFNTNVIEAIVTEGAVTVRGTLSGNIFLSQDDVASSVPFEIPFENVLDVADATLGQNAKVFGVVRQFEYKTEGQKIVIVADVSFGISLTQNLSKSYVCDIAEGDVVATSSAAIEVSLAKKGDSIWDVAKSLNMTTEDVIQLNPELTDPLEKDEKLVIYHRHTA